MLNHVKVRRQAKKGQGEWEGPDVGLFWGFVFARLFICLSAAYAKSIVLDEISSHGRVPTHARV